jgi:transposase
MRANLLDAYRKGRKRQPQSGHANAKLNTNQVQDIRKKYDSGGSKQMELAKEFGVSQRVISLIVRRETYKDVLE